MNLLLTLICLTCNIQELKFLYTNLQVVNKLVLSSFFKLVFRRISKTYSSAKSSIYKAIKYAYKNIIESLGSSIFFTESVEYCYNHYLRFVFTGAEGPAEFV